MPPRRKAYIESRASFERLIHVQLMSFIKGVDAL